MGKVDPVDPPEIQCGWEIRFERLIAGKIILDHWRVHRKMQTVFLSPINIPNIQYIYIYMGLSMYQSMSYPQYINHQPFWALNGPDLMAMNPVFHGRRSYIYRNPSWRWLMTRIIPLYMYIIL
jgi:hypothetical protein